MHEIIPFNTTEEALQTLDNGGRFFNFLTKPGDGTITGSELKKAAGVVSGNSQAFLFLTLSLSSLPIEQRDNIIAQMEPDLKQKYLDSLPFELELEEFEQKASTSHGVIVSGYPKFLEDKTEFTAFIMIPIMTGKTMTFTMIPIFDQFDVYELYKNPEFIGDKTIIATVRGNKRLNPVYTTFAGLANELTFEAKAETSHRYYVETLFYRVSK